MSKLNATQQMIINAFDTYKTGSVAVVRAFEQVMTDYWYKDCCTTTNLQFFVNASKRFPVLHKTIVTMLRDSNEETLMGFFTVKQDGNGGFILTNKKDITKEQKARARLNLKSFIAAQHTSLTAAKSAKKKEEGVAYDMEAGAKSIRSAFERQLKAAFEANPDMDAAFLRTMAEQAIAAVLDKQNVTAIRAKVRKAA